MTRPWDDETEQRLAELRANSPQAKREQDAPPLRKAASQPPSVVVHPVSAAAGEAASDLARAMARERIEAAAQAEVERILEKRGIKPAPATQNVLGKPAAETLGPLEAREVPTSASVPAPSTPEGEGQGAGMSPKQTSESEAPTRHPREVNYSGKWRGGKQIGTERSSFKRFEAFDVEPERVVPLDAAHPAVSEARTVHPKTVVGARESRRFLVSGVNSRKLGSVVEKGPWKGFPIYQVTLEERATCPRSCARWLDCYGNAMHMARRNDHRDPEFLAALDREVRTVARLHPQGFVVRLHTLGDFYSMEYLNLWGDLLFDLQNLHVFGYTARSEERDDEESREMAATIRRLTEVIWPRFAIRFSNTFAPEGTITLMKPSDDPRVIMCPMETGKTAACATCALCWSEAARGKTIGFLLHGRKRPKRRDANQAGMEHSEAGSAERLAGGGAQLPTAAVGAIPAKERALKAPPITKEGVSAHNPRVVPLIAPAKTEEEAERNDGWRSRYDAGESIAEIAGQFGNQMEVRRGILAAGGTLRTKQQAVQLAWRKRKLRGKVLVDLVANEAKQARG